MALNLIRRLYLKALWLRKTYPFLWAHKPLCEKYREDVIAIQGISLCRSCLFVYLGITAGVLFYLIAACFYKAYSAGNLVGMERYFTAFLYPLLAALSCLVMLFSSPYFYKKMPRKIRDLLRFFLGFLIPSFLSLLLFGKILFPLLFLLIFFLCFRVYSRKRVKRKLRICFDCTEYSEEHICSGYILQSELIREYEEEATEYLLRCGYLPDCLKESSPKKL